MFSRVIAYCSASFLRDLGCLVMHVMRELTQSQFVTYNDFNAPAGGLY